MNNIKYYMVTTLLLTCRIHRVHYRSFRKDISWYLMFHMYFSFTSSYVLKTNEREGKRINEGKVNALSAVWQGEVVVFRCYEAEGRIRRRAVASKYHYSDLCFGNHHNEEGRDAERLVVPSHNDFATTTAKPWVFLWMILTRKTLTRNIHVARLWTVLQKSCIRQFTNSGSVTFNCWKANRHLSITAKTL